MKKFSKIDGIKVPEEPKFEIDKEASKINSLKASLIKLMDDILKIQSSGSARTELVNSSVSITGKEVLADSIIDLILNQSNFDKIDLLESLKFEMNDWYLLDHKIEEYNKKIIEDKNQKDINIERKLVTFLEVYSEDKEFENICENYIDRIKSKSDLEHRLNIAKSIFNNKKYNKISKNNLSILINKFQKRIY